MSKEKTTIYHRDQIMYDRHGRQWRILHIGEPHTMWPITARIVGGSRTAVLTLDLLEDPDDNEPLLFSKDLSGK